VHAKARQALDDERVVVLAHLQELHDAGDRAHRVEVGGARVLLFGPPLGDDADHLIVADRVLDERDGLGRPTASGSTPPGKKTELRSGRMGRT
jgi:hypothetical protein